MTVSRFRFFAVAALSLLILGGCAVPGKGEPGVLAEYHDYVITDDDITAIQDAMDELFSGPNAGEDLTLLLIGPAVVGFAEQIGYKDDLSDEAIAERARQWVAYASQGQVGETTVTSAGLRVVRYVYALNLVMHDANGTLALINLVEDIEENAVFSPRYGDFTMEYFSASIQAISDYIAAHSTELSFAQFVMWKDINGFNLNERPEWISGG